MCPTERRNIACFQPDGTAIEWKQIQSRTMEHIFAIEAMRLRLMMLLLIFTEKNSVHYIVWACTLFDSSRCKWSIVAKWDSEGAWFWLFPLFPVLSWLGGGMRIIILGYSLQFPKHRQSLIRAFRPMLFPNFNPHAADPQANDDSPLPVTLGQISKFSMLWDN